MLGLDKSLLLEQESGEFGLQHSERLLCGQFCIHSFTVPDYWPHKQTISRREELVLPPNQSTNNHYFHFHPFIHPSMVYPFLVSLCFQHIQFFLAMFIWLSKWSTQTNVTLKSVCVCVCLFVLLNRLIIVFLGLSVDRNCSLHSRIG